MAFAIELALDEESAAPLRALWRRLAAAGIRFMADSGAEPHVSLVIWERLDVARATAEVAALAAETEPVALGEGCWPHYEPSAWVPHCTLAMDLGPATAATALAVAGSLALPLTGWLQRIAIVEFRPVREHFARPLAGR